MRTVLGFFRFFFLLRFLILTLGSLLLSLGRMSKSCDAICDTLVRGKGCGVVVSGFSTSVELSEFG